MIEKSGSIMSLDQGNALSPAGGYAASDTDAHAPRLIATPADLAGSLRDRTNERLDSGELDTTAADYFFKLADCLEATNTYPIRNPAPRDWFGFGEVEPLLANADDDGFWISLLDAMQVSGMQHDDIQTMFFDDRDDGYEDVYELAWLVNEDGDRNVILLVQHSFVMRAMLRGPWSHEFMNNTMGLFRHAIVKSGLGDKLGPVIRLREDGAAEQTDMTFSEFMSAGEALPSEEEAREQAMRGPLGGAL